MVQHFLRSGTAVTVWNRTESKARALEQHGARVAASPQEAAAGAERIHFVLPDDAIVNRIVQQIGPALERGATIVDHSTTLPEATKERAEQLRARSIRYVHAPVFMSPQMAADGVGLMLVSAARADFEAVKPALDGMTGEVWYLGERPDLAAAYKLFGNCMLFAITGGLADVIAMARANAVDPVEALSVFQKFQAANTINFRGPRMARGETTPASFAVEMARKDVGLMIAAAKGQPLMALPGIAQRMDEVIAAGAGDHDLSALATSAAP
jgi:3-hydroxyisobutyrate dehydrogenase-like beta-hydroxyacid dehydrogenase